MASELDETIKRLNAHKGVEKIVIINSEGIPIRTSPATMEHMTAVQYPALLQPLVTKSKQMIKFLDATNDFMNLRIHSAKNEILVFPDRDYTLIVVQAS